ncbi:hypothetical protein [Poseidonocella sp. HB161398]|uniref:hypothetical protein n=1 Tax=Poseidonocella sp. HB161398 TaxID=2320855 RepID=UPI0011084CC0|nr:hypothetical protein [Poseidonocella sp. HB161398]
MSLKSLLKTAAKSYAKEKAHGHGHRSRPGGYRPGARRQSPKAAAASQAVREVGKLLRTSR